MKADISRMTFRPDRGYAGVLFQQGRVVLDADLNESQAIQSAALARAIVAINGPAWGPADGIGFSARPAVADLDFPIGAGIYYVDGLACVCPAETTFADQPSWSAAGSLKPVPKNSLIYLKVGLRHVSLIQDAELADSALEGIDTATRTQVVWRVVRQDFDEAALPGELKAFFDGLVAGKPFPTAASKALMDVVDPTSESPRGQLKASVLTDPDNNQGIDCDPEPAGGYRRGQNELYRVEIHRGGLASNGPLGATFKWARGNGSVVFPIVKAAYSNDSKDASKTDDGTFKVSLVLAHLGRDRRSGLAPGQWVELLDDAIEADDERAPQLLKVKSVDVASLSVVLEGTGKSEDTEHPDVDSGHAYLRRWDFSHRGRPVDKATGTLLLVDERARSRFELEEGIFVEFDAGAGGEATFRRGDYWLIPARVVGRSIDWPTGADGAFASIPPINPTPSVAPLFVLSAGVGRDARVVVKPAGTVIPTP